MPAHPLPNDCASVTQRLRIRYSMTAHPLPHDCASVWNSMLQGALLPPEATLGKPLWFSNLLRLAASLKRPYSTMTDLICYQQE